MKPMANGKAEAVNVTNEPGGFPAKAYYKHHVDETVKIISEISVQPQILHSDKVVFERDGQG